MARSKYRLYQLSLSMIVLLISPFVSEAMEDSKIQQRIHSHLREIDSGLRGLRESKSHTLLGISSLTHDELIYNSLVAFCTELVSSDGPSTSTQQNSAGIQRDSTPSADTSLKSLVIPSQKVLDSPSTSPISTWPHLFPQRVRAQRDGHSVVLVFDVIHTAAFSVSRYHSFDAPVVSVDYPQPPRSSSSPSPMITVVRIEIDASVCEYIPIPYEHKTASIRFVHSDEQLYVVTTDINLCMFDHFLTKSKDDGEYWEMRKDMIFTEMISPPFFKIMPLDPGDEVILEKGQNVVLEINVALKVHFGIQFQATIWDRRIKGQILTSSIRLQVDNATIRAYPVETNLETLLAIDVIEQTNLEYFQQNGDNEAHNINGPGDGKDTYKVKVRVTVKTSGGRRSGKLTLTYFRRMYSDTEQSIVDFLTTARVILLKLPHKPGLLPKNHVEIKKPDGAFECDNNGMRLFPKHGKNCTVHCHASGTDIKDISITYVGTEGQPPVNSISRVFDGKTEAFAMVDVGPASKEVDGTYRCTAITSNGKKKKQDFKLFTSLFTKVFNNITVYETRNFTAIVHCSAFGAQPLQMTLSVSTDDGNVERVDNKTISERHISIHGHLSNLTVELPIEQLMPPYSSIRCEAKGERGDSSVSLHGRIDNSLEPKINYDPKFTNMTKQKNGTVEIHCEARGTDPMEFVVRNGKDAVVNTLASVRTVVQTPRGYMLNFFVKAKNLKLHKGMACEVINSFGAARHEFQM